MKYDCPPEEILSHHFFLENTKEFYRFYQDKMNCIDKKPNSCHLYLTKLEKKKKLKAIITQNIDGLHQKAKSKNVLELHGSIYRNRCMICNKFYDEKIVFNSKDIPKCDCGGIIKPEVVLYEEPLDDKVINDTIKYISNADLLIIAGTSLTVYPASGLVNLFNGKYFVILNKDETPYDYKADLVIHDKLSKVIKELI